MAVSVWFSLMGSTWRATATTVSNNVLNSVVTFVTSMTSDVEIRCGAGLFGLVKDTYLLPKTVEALIDASTFFSG